MKQSIYKILLLVFVATFISAGSIDLFAKQPAKPIKVGIKVDIMESSPVKGNITLTWVDGDRKNDLGDYFRITQYKKADGKEIVERVGKVERNNKGEYKFVIEKLAVADYCYTIDLYDEQYDIASDLTERVCGKVSDGDNTRKMFFNCKTKLIKLENGQGKFFADVINHTNCEFEIKVLESDARVEVAEQGKKGALLKIEVEKEGKYSAVLGLIDKCSGDIVDKVELLICYGDCVNNDNRMFFAEKSQFIQLSDEGMSATRIKIINETNCEFDIMVVESKVKIAVAEQDENSALIKFTAQEKGKYNSVIGLRNKCTGEIVSKMFFTVCWGDCNPNEPRIYFEDGTEFTHKLEAGTAWRYDINAVSKDDCRLSYYLSDAAIGHNTTPEGLRIDEESGLMVWENPVRGEYKVPVIVRATCDGGVTYSQITGIFYLFVAGDNPDFTSVLKCNFYDETDDIKDFFGKVTVWAADDKDPGVPPTPNRKVFTAELRGTSVTITLPAGKYYLKADVKGYKGQYYKNAFYMKDAKVIEIDENAVVEIDMMLHSIPTPTFHKVTGQVSDAATGEPLPAVVTFLPVKWVLGGKGSDNGNIDFEFDNRVKTDDKGNYSIKLPDTYTYYANAVAMTNTNIYKMQWYEGADSYYEADIIYLDSDKDGINFKLEAAEATQGYMSGSVADKDGNIVMSTVIALHKGDNSEFKAVTRTDEKGYFNFSNLKYGEYVVLSLPAENSYIPGYYVTGDYATLKWKEATLVGVGDFAPTMMVDIIHAPSGKDRAKGIARIKGRLIRGLKGISPGGSGEGNLDEAINGGLVYLMDEAGDVVTHFVTDVDGYFELEELAPGTYTLGIDKFGFDSYTETIEIDYSKDIEIDTEIVLNQVTTSIDYQDFGTAKLLVSPMPVTNISNVSFDGKAGVSNIKLVDITGNVVYQTTLNTIDGKNNFDLDAKNVTAGTYILVIENEENSVAGSITIIK